VFDQAVPGDRRTGEQAREYGAGLPQARREAAFARSSVLDMRGVDKVRPENTPPPVVRVRPLLPCIQVEGVRLRFAEGMHPRPRQRTQLSQDLQRAEASRHALGETVEGEAFAREASCSAEQAEQGGLTKAHRGGERPRPCRHGAPPRIEPFQAGGLFHSPAVVFSTVKKEGCTWPTW